MAQTGVLGIEVSDFTDNVLLDLGRDVTWIARTKFTDNITGSPTYVESAPVIIQGVFTKRALRFNWNKEGMTEMGDAFVMVPFSTAIKREDIIEYESERYRVDTVINRTPGGVQQYKSVILYKMDNA